MVPDPSKSPGRKLQPVIVWCAIICGQDHIKFFELVLVIVVVLPLLAAISVSGERVLRFDSSFHLLVKSTSS